VSTILHVSDPHFGTEVRPVVDALVRLHEELEPDLVVLSGDITQRARRGQFQAARAFVERLGARATLTVPGNHDIPLFHLGLRLFDPYRPYRECFGDVLEPTFVTRDLLVLGVNTTRPRRHKDGEVSEAQIQATAAWLREAAPEQVRVVVVHQPLHVPTETDIANLLHNGARAAAAWSAAGVDLVLGGHIHLPFVLPLADRYPTLSRRAWVVHAGTAVSRRVRGAIPNSVNVLRVGADARHAPRPELAHAVGPEGASAARTADAECRVERWDYGGPERGFHCVREHRLALDR
jgi:3',5'-cyclic AMP phosphodiesterase CpdA